jgi:hypothetical protein
MIMIPQIQATSFGSLTIGEQVYHHDVLIRLSGQVKKRKKKLSKAIYGTSHMISLDEAQHIYQQGAECLIIGTGQYGMVELSDEAAEFFDEQNCQVQLLPTPEALKVWNQAEGAVIAVFHVTC